MRIALVSHANVKAFLRYLPAELHSQYEGLNSGDAHPVVDIAGLLLRSGHSVILYTAAPGLSDVLSCDAGLFSLRCVPLRAGGLPIIDNWRKERDALIALIREDRPDVVNAHWTNFYALAAVSCGIRAVITCHDAPLLCIRYQRLSLSGLVRVWRWIGNTKSIYKQADALIAVSPFLKDYIYSIHGPANCAVIGNIIRGDWGKPRVSGALKAGDCVVFACVGGPYGIKNTRVVVNAFVRLSRNVNCRLMVFGGGWEALSKEYSSAPISFLPNDTREGFVAILKKQIDVFVHPSLLETQGIAMCEAMACGIPVIGGLNSGAVPWVLDSGAAGLLVDVTSSEAIYEAMAELAVNTQLRAALGARARDVIAERFSEDIIYSEYMRLLTCCGR